MRIRAAVAALAAVLVPQISQACAVCFGQGSQPAMTEGTNNAIIFLLLIVAFVQVGFIALFLTFWRRGKALRKFREQFRVVGGRAH